MATWRGAPAVVTRRVGIHAATVRATVGTSGGPIGAGGGLRPGACAGDSARRGCGQDARLPCRRVVAAAPPMTMDVSIVILNYNTRDHLRACLRALQVEGSTSLGGGPSDAEVLVVDNASSDGSAQMVAAEFPWVRLIRSPRN